MNILPKKRWHVRTKDNIARVRRDEALAAEEEKKKQLRIQIAEREARTEALRKKARQQYGSKDLVQPEPSSSTEQKEESSSNQHVNLFYELEQNEIVSNKTNEEYEKEKKLEREKYEKQIGYLTYLGQDTNELTGNVSWYNKSREEIHNDKTEVSKKQKIFEDPLVDIRKYLGCEGVKKVAKIEDKKEVVHAELTKTIKRKRSSSESLQKRKKHKKEKKSNHKKKKKKKHKKNYSTDSEESSYEVEKDKKPKIDVERLRAERLRRELEERRRADELFAKINGVNIKKEDPPSEPIQKYNSQFNPHLAKQNYK